MKPYDYCYEYNYNPSPNEKYTKLTNISVPESSKCQMDIYAAKIAQKSAESLNELMAMQGLNASGLTGGTPNYSITVSTTTTEGQSQTWLQPGSLVAAEPGQIINVPNWQPSPFMSLPLPSGETYEWLSPEERELIQQFRKNGKSVKIIQETTIVVEDEPKGRKFKEV